MLSNCPMPQTWLLEPFVLLSAPGQKRKSGCMAPTPEEQVLGIERHLQEMRQWARATGTSLACVQPAMLSRKFPEELRKRWMVLAKKFHAGMASAQQTYPSISAADFMRHFLHGEYDDVLQNTHDPSQKGKFWPWVKAKLAELNAAQEAAQAEQAAQAAEQAAQDAEQAAHAAEQLLQDNATATRVAQEDAQSNAISKLLLAHHRACAGWHARHMLTAPAVLLEAQEVLSARSERRMAAEEDISQPFHLLPYRSHAKELPWASTAWQHNLAPESVRPRVVLLDLDFAPSWSPGRTASQ